MAVDVDKLMQDKRVEGWAAWFVSSDWKLLRFNSDIHGIDNLPVDGFLCAKTKFRDGTGENIGGGGWIVVMETPAGLLFQSTGDDCYPQFTRYPGAKFIKDKLAPSNLWHVASAEANAWL